ncbi:hypothetical protein FHG87_006004 [Trinorchestia longiramus]|nr:hypothetical protein FHG87_006004 [Trinorchestia longiramus]
MFTRYCDTGLSAHTIGVDAELPSVITSVSNSANSSLSVDITDLAISSNNCGASDRVVTVISEAHSVPELYRPTSPVDPAPDTPTITRILLSPKVIEAAASARNNDYEVARGARAVATHLFSVHVVLQYGTHIAVSSVHVELQYGTHIAVSSVHVELQYGTHIAVSSVHVELQYGTHIAVSSVHVVLQYGTHIAVSSVHVELQ